MVADVMQVTASSYILITRLEQNVMNKGHVATLTYQDGRQEEYIDV
jgi:hypothetical protein